MSSKTPDFNAIESIVLCVVFSCAFTALVQILALLLFVGLCVGVLFLCGAAIDNFIKQSLVRLSARQLNKETTVKMPVSEEAAVKSELQPENKTVVSETQVDAEGNLDSLRAKLPHDVLSKPTQAEVASIQPQGKQVVRLELPNSLNAPLTMCACDRYPLLVPEFVSEQLRLEREEVCGCSSTRALRTATAVAEVLDEKLTSEGISMLSSSLDLATEAEIQAGLTIRQMRSYASANQLENYSRCKNKADFVRFFVQRKMLRSQLLDAMAMPKHS